MKTEKVVANLHDTTEYVIHIISVKHSLNHGFVLQKIEGVIKFN